jgi:hypothetical protein
MCWQGQADNNNNEQDGDHGDGNVGNMNSSSHMIPYQKNNSNHADDDDGGDDDHDSILPSSSPTIVPPHVLSEPKPESFSCANFFPSHVSQVSKPQRHMHAFILYCHTFVKVPLKRESR